MRHSWQSLNHGNLISTLVPALHILPGVNTARNTSHA
jgi:hypothetical protein